jgi:hypothetical protein
VVLVIAARPYRGAVLGRRRGALLLALYAAFVAALALG